MTRRDLRLLVRAGYQAGVVASPSDIADLWQRDALFEPAMQAEQRTRLFEGWNDAVGRVRTVR